MSDATATATAMKLKHTQTLRSLDDMKRPEKSSIYFVDWQDMENIRVVCRFRPEIELEIKLEKEKKNNNNNNNNNEEIIENKPPTYVSETTVLLERPESSKRDNQKQNVYQCDLDFILPSDSQQSHSFHIVGRPMVDSCLDGFNGTIFAYGQTGSGKTYSMFGPEKRKEDSEYGLVPRSVAYLFKELQDKLKHQANEKNISEKLMEYNVTLQCVQIYKSDLLDLLHPEKKVKLAIKTNFADDSVYVEHLRTLPIDNVKEFLEELTKAMRNRKVASHQLNALSSRSHMLVMLKIIQKFRDGSVKTSNLNFGDLAGSEDIRKALGDNPDQERLKEAIAINSSLTALTTCINDIVHKKKPTHRVHPLTHILKDSLGGNSKATVVVCCSPHMSNRNETIRTLRFAEAAKQVKNKAKINTELGKTAMQNRIKELERENQDLNNKVLEMQALLDVVQSQKRQVAIETGGHQMLIGMKDMRQASAARNLPNLEEFRDARTHSITENENEEREKSESLSEEDVNVEHVLDGMEKESEPTLQRESTIDKLLLGPDELNKRQNEEMEKAKADLNQKNQELEDSKKREETYQHDLQKYIDLIAELRKRIEDQDGIIKDQERQIAELQLQLQELQNANSNLQNEVSNLQNETKKEKVDEEKEALRQEVEKLRKEMEDLKKENKESEDQLEKELGKVQNQLQTHRSAAQELRKETEQQKVNIAELESENAALHKQLDSLRAEKVRNAHEKKRSSVELAQSATELSNADVKTNNVVIERTEEELQLNLSPIELLLYRIAGNDMIDSRMPQEQKVKKVCDMVLALAKEIGDLMDRWLQKSKQQKTSGRLRSDKLLFQARSLIAQFTVCNNQLGEYEASNLNAILHENRTYKKECKDLQKKLSNKETDYRILMEKNLKLEEQVKELLDTNQSATLGNEAEFLEEVSR